MTQTSILSGIHLKLVFRLASWTVITILAAVPVGAKESEPVTAPKEVAGVTKANLDQYMLMKTQELFATMRDNKELVDTDYDSFYDIVAAQINTWVDTKRLAKGVLHKHYQNATEPEIEDFITTMQTSMLETYSGVLTQLVLDSLVINNDLNTAKDRKKKGGKKAKPKRDDRASVRLSITLITGQTFPMQYSVAKGKDGHWRIYNIIVGGVNLGLTYRNQFRSAMQDPKNEGKIAKVIEGWGQPLSN